MKKLFTFFFFMVISVNIFSQAIPKQINYQGVLKDASGNLITGNITLQFSIYNNYTGGTPLWTEVKTVAVFNGLLNTQLGSETPITGVSFDRMHFLGVTINSGTEMAPRTQLTPTPYSFMAMNVMDGIITSPKIADNQIVRSLNGLKDDVTLIAGANITLTPSGNGITVAAAGGGGVGGSGISNYIPLFSAPTTLSSSAIYQNGPNIGVGTITPASPVSIIDSGVTTNAAEITKKSASGYSLYTEKQGGSGISIKGNNTGSTGSGVGGYSTNYIGLWGETNAASNNYGIYTPDNLFSLNFHTTGAFMQVVKNTGNEVLEMGDVVSVAGIEQNSDGLQIINIQKASPDKLSGVIGVVHSYFPQEYLPGKSTPEGVTGQIISSTSVQPNEYLLIVVQGPAKVKTDASVKLMQPGDLLSLSDQPGYAGKVKQVQMGDLRIAVPGTVLGKLLDPGTNQFSTVYITLK